MPESSGSSSHFIPQELRPFVGVQPGGPAPLPAHATPNELNQRAVESLNGFMKRRYQAVKDNAAPLGVDLVFRPAADVAVADLDGEAVLLNLNSGSYYSLNFVGTLIWQEIAASQSLGNVSSNLCARFDVAADVAWRDLTSLVNHLKREGLVEEAIKA